MNSQVESANTDNTRQQQQQQHDGESSKGNDSSTATEPISNVKKSSTIANLTTATATPAATTRQRKKQYAVSTHWERQVAEGTLPTDIHSYFCCCATRIGHMFALASYADGSPMIMAGPCWPFCVFLTVPLILGITIPVAYFVIYSKHKFNLVRKNRSHVVIMDRTACSKLIFLIRLVCVFVF
jgi:hypothetical protein